MGAKQVNLFSFVSELLSLFEHKLYCGVKDSYILSGFGLRYVMGCFLYLLHIFSFSKHVNLTDGQTM